MNLAKNEGALFISHADEDLAEARKLRDALKRAGFSPWFREESLLPGQRVDAEIRRAIGACRFFLVLLSANSVKRGAVNRELTRALTIIDEFPESDIFIIPVRLDQSEPAHEKLQKLAPVDMFPDWETGFEKILAAIESGADRPTNPGEEAPSSAPGLAIEESGASEKQ